MKLITVIPFLIALNSLYRMQRTIALNVSMTLPLKISGKKQQLLPVKIYILYWGDWLLVV